MNHLPIALTDGQRAHLKQLADYLAALPGDYEHFDMNHFCRVGSASREPSSLPWGYSEGCGTVACAIGHGPAAGIPVPVHCRSWGSYATAVFGADPWRENGLFDWCFAGAWHGTDNTPQGAAQRIYVMLDKGVPENYFSQMQGAEPLCYH
jgi:hypothetical protein